MASEGESRSILVIDDEPAVTLMLSNAFGRDDVSVAAASRLDTAEQVLCRRRFDLVIADVHLGGILGSEGLELLSYIKRNWPRTKVLIMTAYGTPEKRQEAFERGADYYYEKPFDVIEVQKIMREIREATIKT
jgi:two-component system response regulator (stage 0 sporulation protein F)